jgi:Fe-S-cluster containining protein
LIVPLGHSHPCRYGVPVIDKVETDIFVKSYYGDCMGCNFCHDLCCQHGADTTALDLANIAGWTDELEAYVRVPRGQWFTGQYEFDEDWPGGKATRTRTKDGRCVFLNRAGRGCLIHSFALERGIDVHEIKPMVCLMWPVTWTDGTLYCSNEVADNDLICVGPGQTCYRSARNDLGWYFGPALLADLDAREAEVLAELGVPATIPLTLLPPGR